MAKRKHQQFLRQYFPKSMKLNDVSIEDVFKAAHKLNSRPRKCLGYKTPYATFELYTGVNVQRGFGCTLNELNTNMIQEKVMKVTFVFLLLIIYGCGGNNGGSSAGSSEQPHSNATHGQIVVEMSANSGKIKFDTSMDFELYRTTQINCTLEVYATCANSMYYSSLQKKNSGEIEDKFLTLMESNNILFHLKNKKNNTVQTINTSIFSRRYKHEVIEFNSELYLIGGVQRDDVWRSVDGAHWEKVKNNAQFSTRWGHQVVVFNNKLFLIAGSKNHTASDEVWESSDGIDWREITTSAEKFSARQEHQAVVYNNKIYVIGGLGKNDVWSSVDGIDWKEENSSAAFPAKGGHQVVIFNGNLFLVGTEQDVWRSNNGADWTQIGSIPLSANRWNHQVEVFNDKLYLIGGHYEGSGSAYNTKSDVWVSSDGIHWSLLTEALELPDPGIEDHQVIAFKGHLFLIGGSREGNDYGINHIWKSSDGVKWKKTIDSTVFSGRNYFATAKIKNTIYLIGGSGIENRCKNDVWKSNDGFVWSKVIDNATFSARCSHQLLNFNDELYLIAGVDFNASNNQQKNRKDIWKSSNGIDWELVSDNLPFIGRYSGFTEISSYQYINSFVFNGKLFILQLPPSYPDSDFVDAWSSFDGKSWSKTSENFASRRSKLPVITYKASVYLYGDGDTNEVLQSTDGANWNKIADNVTTSTLSHFEIYGVVVHRNQVFLFGGNYFNSTENELWKSSDGINFSKVGDIPFRTSYVVDMESHLLVIDENYANVPYMNDVWKSTNDGENWSKVITILNQ